MTLDNILSWIEGVTAGVAAFPSPLSPEAATVLGLEKIIHAAIRAHAASTGKSVDEIVAGLKHVEQV